MPFRYTEGDIRPNDVQNISQKFQPQPFPSTSYHGDHVFPSQADQLHHHQHTAYSHGLHPELPPVLYNEGRMVGAPGGGAVVLQPPPSLSYHTTADRLSPYFDSFTHFQSPVDKQQQFQDDTTTAGFHQPSFPLQNPFSRDPLSPQSLEAYLHPDYVPQFQQRQQQAQAEALAQSHLQSPPTPQPTAGPSPRNLLQRSATPLPTALISHLVPPSPHGLPVYSASGFDLLPVLARVPNRPNPQIALGPVDLTCSFVVVDIRQDDHPIIYCSPTFCQLTGYSEAEILWKNCRFLQSPDGVMRKGESRRHTPPDAVAYLHKNLSANKECQATLVNYKKGGEPFVNHVTVIPVPADDNSSEIAYHIGFQVDLHEQPNAILRRMREGNYMVDSKSRTGAVLLGSRKPHVIPYTVMSKDLEKILQDPKFLESIPISSAAHLPTPSSSNTLPSLTPLLSPREKPEPVFEHGHRLNLILLEALPDFILVVSLKGSFLYVAPSVRRVLGYESQELIGKEIKDLAHPEDVVPLMRELKESSITGTTLLPSALAASLGGSEGSSSSSSASNDASTFSFFPLAVHTVPKTVDLLFRARTKAGVYVWVECRGRLHVEPGKGRKAIILSARAKLMSGLEWKSVSDAGGLLMPNIETSNGAPSQVDKLTDPGGGGGGETEGDDDGGGGGGNPVMNPSEGLESRPTQTIVENEFWGMLSPEGDFLVVGNGVRDVLGWDIGDMIGRDVGVFIAGDETQKTTVVKEIGKISLEELRPSPEHQRVKFVKLRVGLKHKDGRVVDSEMVLYAPSYAFTDVGLPSEGLGVHAQVSQRKAVEIAAEMVKKYYSPAQKRVNGQCVAVRPPPVAYQVKPVEALQAQTPNPISHPLRSNVFEEMMISRGSSWQYEVEKLKLSNQKLLEEIEELEARSKAAEAIIASGGTLPQAWTSSFEEDEEVATISQSMASTVSPFMQPPPHSISQQQHQPQQQAAQQQQQQQPAAYVPSMFPPPSPMDRHQYIPSPSALPYPYRAHPGQIPPRHVSASSSSTLASSSMPDQPQSLYTQTPLGVMPSQASRSPTLQRQHHPVLRQPPTPIQPNTNSLYRPLSAVMGPSSSPFSTSQMPSVRTSAAKGVSSSVGSVGTVAPSALVGSSSSTSAAASSSSSSLKRSWAAVER